jgi:hypothetical protein
MSQTDEVKRAEHSVCAAFRFCDDQWGGMVSRSTHLEMISLPMEEISTQEWRAVALVANKDLPVKPIFGPHRVSSGRAAEPFDVEAFSNLQTDKHTH